MKYVKLGKTGVTVSRICLGCMSYGSKSWNEWTLSEEDARPHFARALELGINFFDTANVYSQGVSEQITGRYLREMAKRDELVVASKVCNPMGKGLNQSGLSRKHILDQCDASLRRLGMDYIDLYQIHRYDPTTPIEETLEALDYLVRVGKVRYLGASSMAAWQFAKALFTAGIHGWHRFVTMQNQYSLVFREEEIEMNPLCADQGIGLLPWGPLAGGFMTGNRSRSGQPLTPRANAVPPYRPQYRDSDYAIRDEAEKIAGAHGVSVAEVALAWVLQAPCVTAAIVGATKLEHIVQAVAAVEVTLGEEEVAALEAPYQIRASVPYVRPKASHVLSGEYPTMGRR